jgi:pentose-5-phosphate-3-epimerase
MAEVVPSITAYNTDEYRHQIEKLAGFAHRLHIDLMDEKFTGKKSIPAENAWWPAGVKADFHVMSHNPHHSVDIILEHRPNMIVIHAEASGDFSQFSSRLKHLGVKVGVALLATTPVTTIMPAIDKIDHVLIFSGNLGEYGGHANLDLLHKVQTLKQHRPQLEIGWDGGVNDRNISQLVFGGVDVFDVGGFIQNAPDPERAFHSLARIADETGTT